MDDDNDDQDIGLSVLDDCDDDYRLTIFKLQNNKDSAIPRGQSKERSF